MSVRDRLRFALIGALACLAAAFAAEALFGAPGTDRFLWRRHDPSLLFDVGPLDAESARRASRDFRGYRPETVRRLLDSGAQGGEVQATLTWNNRNDLDLHVVDPEGQRIYYRNRLSRSGGMLDVDRNAGPPLTTSPVENIFWPVGMAPQGLYSVYVHYFDRKGDPDPTPYQVELRIRGRVQRFTGSLSMGDPMRLVHEFTLGPAGAADRAMGEQVPFWRRLPPGPLDGLPSSWLPDFATAAVWGAFLASLLSALLTWAVLHALGGRERRGVGKHLLAAVKALGFGALAGLSGEALFTFVGLLPLPAGLFLARAAGFALLSGLSGLLLGSLVPCLPPRKAWRYGVLGGILAACAFALTGSEAGGRLPAAAAIGAAIGLAVTIVRMPRRRDLFGGEELYAAVPSLRPNRLEPLHLGPRPESNGHSPVARPSRRETAG